MNSAQLEQFRRRWRENRRIDKAVPEETVVDEVGRALLTREQFDAIREAVLMGMQVMASQDPVNSRRFKVLRDAWTELAQAQGKSRLVIEVERE